MAQVFGERSKYLIWMDYASRIAFFLMGFALLYLIGGYFLINFGTSATLIKIIVATILYAPFLVLVIYFFNIYFRSYVNFFNGRSGEYNICDELQKLPDSYYIFRNLKLNKYGDTDLIIVGPTGIFTLEVKSHYGRVEFNGNELLRKGKKFENNFLSQAMNEALSLKDYLTGNGIGNIFIEPVLVFSNKYASVRFGMNKIKNVYVIQKRFLNDLILNSRGSLSPENIVAIKNTLLQSVQKK